MTTASRETPRAASARRYLRASLPAVYSEAADGAPPTVMGLLKGLEQVLDPVVALLDNLSSHLQPATAPADMIDFLSRLTGAPVDPTLPVEARRRLLQAGARIAAMRGTKAGLELALRCAFPHLEPVVVDHGGATCEPAAGRASFEVHVRASRPLSPDVRAQLDRCVADHLPVGVVYDLRRVEPVHGGERRG